MICSQSYFQQVNARPVMAMWRHLWNRRRRCRAIAGSGIWQITRNQGEGLADL